MLQLLGKCFYCSAFYITAGRLVEMYQPEKTVLPELTKGARLAT